LFVIFLDRISSDEEILSKLEKEIEEKNQDREQKTISQQYQGDMFNMDETVSNFESSYIFIELGEE
jgi:hypothetical protein